MADEPAVAATSTAAPMLLEEVRARGLATKAHLEETVTELYGPDALTLLRSLAKPDAQVAVAEMLMAGLSVRQCAVALNLHPGTIAKWFARDTQDMQRLMKTALTKDALLEIPKSWGTLKKGRDSENQETARKAALDCMRAAGLPIDPGAEGGKISINAQNLQFNHMSVADLDRKILDLAEKLGPEAVKLANAEVRGDGRTSGGSAPAAPDGDRQPDAGPGEAAPDGGVPGAPGGAPAP